MHINDELILTVAATVLLALVFYSLGEIGRAYSEYQFKKKIEMENEKKENE